MKKNSNIKPSILVVDDSKESRVILSNVLEKLEYDYHTAANGSNALNLTGKFLPDVILLDIHMPGMDGFTVLKKLKENQWIKAIPVIMITMIDEMESINQCIYNGAFDYVTKPFNYNELSLRIKRAVETRQMQKENMYLKSELANKYRFHNIIGKSKPMQKIFSLIKKVAPADSSVIIYGASGTGKELVARAIHFNSKRREKPFIKVDCSALSATLLESELFGHVKGAFTGAGYQKQGLIAAADNGTLFLDEIGNIPLSLQTKLLRVLQEKEIKPVGSVTPARVNVRVITATNADLKTMINQKQFRADLYYRLHVIPISLPPLKQRKEDLPLLIKHFCKKYKRKKISFSAQCIDYLTSYEWPGNVRELKNIIERLQIMADTDQINLSDLPEHIRHQHNVNIDFNIPATNRELKKRKKEIRSEAVIEIEKAFISKALTQNNYNITAASKAVGLNRVNFHALMRKHNFAGKPDADPA
ncbi:MAG TPA: sigma-54 dependent transcriptional regulator [Spirochaetota bacterium]|nr:sigma-54 dependent transcriptional regulator [Spirochaetota bacterium]